MEDELITRLITLSGLYGDKVSLYSFGHEVLWEVYFLLARVSW